MLTFKSLSDVREYLAVRREMAKRQGVILKKKSGRMEYPDHTQGMLYAYDESLRALDAFLAAQEPTPSPLEDSGTGIPWNKS